MHLLDVLGFGQRAATAIWAASVLSNSKRLISRFERVSTEAWELQLVLIVAGLLAWHHSITIGVRDMDSAMVANFNSPATDGSAFTFRYSYADIYDPRIPVGAGLIVGGFVLLAVGTLRTRRQR